jgi:hypothetical protein
MQVIEVLCYCLFELFLREAPPFFWLKWLSGQPDIACLWLPLRNTSQQVQIWSLVMYNYSIHYFLPCLHRSSGSLRRGQLISSITHTAFCSYLWFESLLHFKLNLSFIWWVPIFLKESPYFAVARPLVWHTFNEHSSAVSALKQLFFF